MCQAAELCLLPLNCVLIQNNFQDLEMLFGFILRAKIKQREHFGQHHKYFLRWR